MDKRIFSLDDLEFPPDPVFKERIRRAPSRGFELNENDTILAVKNALRYVPLEYHEKLAPEFLNELMERGRIYGYRFMGEIKAKPIDQYKGIIEAKAIQLMIDNNLDFEVALYPYELITYGESGAVCQNWMQYRLIKKYLENMTKTQTLVVMSGHPLGLFPSKRDAPRVISTNGLMVGMYDTTKDFHRAQALGVANYGQMTAGGWMYIGPQGIVHGTYITLLNAGRLYLKHTSEQDLAGKTYLSSGLGGMSGAQAKAIEIAGGIGIFAEVDKSRIDTRHNQGWLSLKSSDLEQIFEWVKEYQANRKPVSIGYLGNIVDLWQYVVDNNISIDLASDQTSCHAVYEGGYTPVGLSFEEGREMIKSDKDEFDKLVDVSLRKQYELISEMVKRGTHFWDYGNSFLKAVFDAGVNEIAVDNDPKNGFVFKSYVEELVGPIVFDYGYGPFRWVCTSLDPEDLHKTDKIAMDCINPERRAQDRDNWNWVRDAEKNQLVVGSQARILYADAQNRVKIALEFNKAIREGHVSRPIMLGRDHHDTGGTDSPFRETSNILDGSNIMSDMAHHCWAGNTARGMTMCVLSNGGGVGTGKVINGGFGLVLDGSERVDDIIKIALDWDVNVGVARRAWARNPNAVDTAAQYNLSAIGHITLPKVPEKDFIEELVKKKLQE